MLPSECFAHGFETLIFPDGDVLHLGCDLAAFGVVHLRDAAARAGAQRMPTRAGELRLDARPAPVVFGASRAAFVRFDVVALLDPLLAQRR